MIKRIFGLECEYGLTFSPTGRVYLPIEKILGYIFEGLIPNSWPSNAFLTTEHDFIKILDVILNIRRPNATI